MPRAPKACPIAGCPKPITVRGRCDVHQFPSWERADTRRELTDRPHRERRRRVLRRDGGRCVVCGAPAAEVDHVVAKFLGGADHVDNMASLCTTCHKLKTAREAVLARRMAAAARGRIWGKARG